MILTIFDLVKLEDDQKSLSRNSLALNWITHCFGCRSVSNGVCLVYRWNLVSLWPAAMSSWDGWCYLELGTQDLLRFLTGRRGLSLIGFAVGWIGFGWHEMVACGGHLGKMLASTNCSERYDLEIALLEADMAGIDHGKTRLGQSSSSAGSQSWSSSCCFSAEWLHPGRICSRSGALGLWCASHFGHIVKHYCVYFPSLDEYTQQNSQFVPVYPDHTNSSDTCDYSVLDSFWSATPSLTLSDCPSTRTLIMLSHFNWLVTPF